VHEWGRLCIIPWCFVLQRYLALGHTAACGRRGGSEWGEADKQRHTTTAADVAREIVQRRRACAQAVRTCMVFRGAAIVGGIPQRAAEGTWGQAERKAVSWCSDTSRRGWEAEAHDYTLVDVARENLQSRR